MTDDEHSAEACGRCSMTAVVDAVNVDKTPDERAGRDPFGGERIEVEEGDLRRISPAGWLADTKARLDTVARRIAYGK